MQTKYEYKVLCSRGNDDMLKQVNELGRQGWRVVDSTAMAHGHNPQLHPSLLLERPIKTGFWARLFGSRG